MSQILCRLSHLIVDETQSVQTVVLKERNGVRSLQIGIGIFEALAIQRLLDGDHFPRPLTHDLLAICVQALGGSCQGLHITSLDGEGTYFAHITLQKPQKCMEIDCRPSDGLALILRYPKAKITVAEDLFSTAEEASEDEE